MAAPKGNQNAKGNKGGGRKPHEGTIKHKLNIDRIAGKAWYEAEKVIDDVNYPDQDFRKKLILKIVGNSVPRDLRLAGDGVNPIKVLVVEKMEPVV